MSTEALCVNVSDAFDNVTSTQKSISNENIDEMVSVGTTESDIVEELINDENAFYEYNGDDDGITKRNVKLWKINGVFYNKSEVQSICEPVSRTKNIFEINNSDYITQRNGICWSYENILNDFFLSKSI